MEKRFIVAGSKDVVLLSKDELHVLLSSVLVSNMVIIDRNNLENVSLAMCSDIAMKCVHNPLALMLYLEMLKRCFDDKDYKGIDTLLITLID
jgi:hypothetical protein